MKILLSATLAGLVLGQKIQREEDLEDDLLITLDDPPYHPSDQSSREYPTDRPLDEDQAFSLSDIMGDPMPPEEWEVDRDQWHQRHEKHEKHHEKHHKDGKKHHKHHKHHHGHPPHGCIIGAFVIVAVLFMSFGFCCAKCIQKKKEHCNRRRNIREERKRNAAQVEKEIEKCYDEIGKLQIELEKKRQEEARQIPVRPPMQFGYPQPIQFYHAPQQHPPQQQPYYRHMQVPRGKPINESFESEYPQL